MRTPTVTQITRTSILLIGFATGAEVAHAQYDLSWYTIDGGGGTSSGGAFSVSGTVGQFDAQPPPVMSGGGYSATGGFWAVANVCTCPGDLDGDHQLTGLDIQRFVTCYIAGGSACQCADVNANSVLDPGDVTTFVNSLIAGTPCP